MPWRRTLQEMAKVAKVPTKAAEKKAWKPAAAKAKPRRQGLSPQRGPSPQLKTARRKLRFLQHNIGDLPWNVVQLLDASSKQEQGRLINKIVVGKLLHWSTKGARKAHHHFKLDDPYLQESVRRKFVHRSPKSASARVPSHRDTPKHSKPPSRNTTGSMARNA